MPASSSVVVEEAVANGGAGMNAAFLLIVAALYLQMYSSQWFQNIHAAASTLLRPSSPTVEMDLEEDLLNGNWSFYS